MIYTLLKAQLGNQLFIIFNTISLAKKYDVEYKIICNKNEKTQQSFANPHNLIPLLCFLKNTLQI